MMRVVFFFFSRGVTTLVPLHIMHIARGWQIPLAHVVSE